MTADSASVIFSATLPGHDAAVLGQVGLPGGEITSAAGTEFIEGVHPRLRPIP